MIQEANGLITLMVLIAMAILLVVAAMGWLIHTDKAKFDDDKARNEADKLLADANRSATRRVRAGTTQPF